MEPAIEEAETVPRLDSAPSPAQPTDSDQSEAQDLNGDSISNAELPESQSPGPSRPLSGVVPPYWQRHERNASRASQSSLAQGITLEDHTEEDCETARDLWAQSVLIEDYAVVRGMNGVGSYVVWNCKIQTLDGGPMVVRMRYSEFDELRRSLVSAFPGAKSALPALPPKSIFFKFRASFLESRRVGLEYFLNCVLLNPEFSSSAIVKDFLFGRLS